MKLNKYIDHTLLKPDAKATDIEKLCFEAKQYEFASVCVNPIYVSLAHELLQDFNPFSNHQAIILTIKKRRKMFQIYKKCSN
jgi:deoxyribose-phosphate aldolase